MAVIVTACASFGLTVSAAKTEIMCLQKNGGGARAVHRYCSRQSVPKNGRVCGLRWGYQRRLGSQKHRVTRRNQTAWTRFRRYKIDIYDRPSVRLHLMKVRMLNSKVMDIF